MRTRARKLAGGMGQVLPIAAGTAVAALSVLLVAAELTPTASLTLAPPNLLAQPVTPVSDEFRRRIEAATASLPDSIWRTLWRAGWRVQLAELVVDAAPSLRAERPRGWPAGQTWENTDAVNLPQRRLVVVAEKRRNRNGEIVSSVRIEGVFRHELGHAYDNATGGKLRCHSARPEFVAAYDADLQGMMPEQQAELEYYLQGAAAGRQEAYAEAFAIFLGGGSDPEKREAFLQAFPRVTGYLQRSLTEQETVTQTAER